MIFEYLCYSEFLCYSELLMIFDLMLFELIMRHFGIVILLILGKFLSFNFVKTFILTHLYLASHLKGPLQTV